MLSSHIKLFQKIKRSLDLVFLLHFPHNFGRKIFILLYSITWPNFIVRLPLLSEILGNMCIAIVWKPGCDIMISKLTLSFSNQAVIPTWPKSLDKNLNISRMERAFKTKQKAFFIIFKGLSIKEIKKCFWKVRIRL